MKFGSGALLVAVGLLVLWLAASGRLVNLSSAWATLNGEAPAANGLPPVAKLNGTMPLEALPPLPVVVG